LTIESQRCVPAGVHATSAFWDGALGADGEATGDEGLLVVSAAVMAMLPAAAAAVALATMAANDVLGGGRRDGRRAAAVDGKTGSWNTLATRIWHNVQRTINQSIDQENFIRWPK